MKRQILGSKDIKIMKLALTFSILVLSFYSMINNASAKTCSTKSKLVCVQVSQNAVPTDTCIANSTLKSHFIENPLSFIGGCNEFDTKKIKTYACNAGLRFLKPVNSICIRRDQNNTTSTSCGDSQDCVCNMKTETEAEVNYFNFGIAEYNGTENLTFIKKTKDTSLTSAYTMASSNSGQHILEGGSSLQFNLGSEFYGAEYVLDLCIKNQNLNSYQYDLDVNGKIYFSNTIFKNTGYNQAAALSGKIDVICENTNGTFTTKNISAESRFISADRNYAKKIDGSNLCIIRQYFNETAVSSIRENSFKKITFQSNITVTPNDQTLLIPTKVKFCNIKPKNSNSYTCSEWTSNSYEIFPEDIKNSVFFGQDTYTGSCPNNCKPF